MKTHLIIREIDMKYRIYEFDGNYNKYRVSYRENWFGYWQRLELFRTLQEARAFIKKHQQPKKVDKLVEEITI